MTSKYLCKDVETGKVSTLKISYDVVINAGPLREIEQNGRTYKILESTRKSFGETVRRPQVHHVTKRSSLGSGVHRDQVSEAREVAIKVNSGIEIKQDGAVSFADRRARRDWFKHNKIRDKDGGYGD